LQICNNINYQNISPKSKWSFVAKVKYHFFSEIIHLKFKENTKKSEIFEEVYETQML